MVAGDGISPLCVKRIRIHPYKNALQDLLD